VAFGVYIHIPYCTQKCPYCDFNSWGVGFEVPEQEYTNALLSEIRLYADVLASRTLDTVYLGGGTPSLFSPQSVGAVVEALCRAAPSVAAGLEVTVEANPESVDVEKLAGYRAAGVNRVSVGVQSLSPRKLGLLGRRTSPDDIRRAVDAVSEAGIVNVNIDLIFATPGETLEEWEHDLEGAVALGPTHFSCYGLTVEEGTPFWSLARRGLLHLPDEEASRAMLLLAVTLLARRGYERYEISNFARPGYECRHNLLYWRGEDYLGLGAGAHSHLRSTDVGETRGSPRRWSNVRNPRLYMEKAVRGEPPVAARERLDAAQVADETLLMGLRLAEGVSITDLRSRTGLRPDPERIAHLVREGFLRMEGDRLSLSDEGFLLADAVIERVCRSFTP